jgi:ABC-type polysaccharide/polyol phosphate export permease
MTSVITAPPVAVTAPARAPAAPRPRHLTALAVLARRRLALSARTPRELITPLLTPILFAVVIAPALADQFNARPGGVDYMTFAAIATIGLLIPLSCVTAGLGVVVDRTGGGRPDLLAAPVPRPLIVLGNLVVALFLSGLQLVALLVAASLRGAEFDVRATGVLWFAAAVVGFAILMYGIAEAMANRIPTQEEYVGALPAIAIVPWFFGGSLFPISAMPVGLTAFAKALPITHVLALLRYGVADTHGHALHDIWGMDNTTTMAALSLAVVVGFAALFTAVSIRVFARSATN